MRPQRAALKYKNPYTEVSELYAYNTGVSRTTSAFRFAPTKILYVF